MKQRDNKDLAIHIVGELVVAEIIEDCTDTDDNTEFEAQDIIIGILDERFPENKNTDDENEVKLLDGVERARRAFILGDVRQRLGADDSNSETEDETIKTMTDDELMHAYVGWHLGDGEWWTSFAQKLKILKDNRYEHKDI